MVARVVASRLSQWSESFLSEEQSGFRRGRGTDDALQVAWRIIEEARALTSGKAVALLFYDIERAYHRVC